MKKLLTVFLLMVSVNCFALNTKFDKVIFHITSLAPQLSNEFTICNYDRSIQCLKEPFTSPPNEVKIITAVPLYDKTSMYIKLGYQENGTHAYKFNNVFLDKSCKFDFSDTPNLNIFKTGDEIPVIYFWVTGVENLKMVEVYATIKIVNDMRGSNNIEITNCSLDFT